MALIQTLPALHMVLGTAFRVPHVMGRELNLHMLYKNVSRARCLLWKQLKPIALH